MFAIKLCLATLPDTTLRFDRFELQPHERRLLDQGEPLTIGTRAFDVLHLLLRRAGSLVTKAELLDQVWAGLVVEEANLTVQVSTLRKLLGAELIATVPGRGYRFTGRVLGLAAAPAPSALGPAAAAPEPEARPESRLDASLVGRTDDLQRARAALLQPGCVTLAGPAGVGKTSLARALAAGWSAGVVWVDLAVLQDESQLVPAWARALGVPAPPPGSLDSLLQAQGARLLVLDNAEHLVDAVARQVAALVAADPARVWLVTSQLPLAVPGERVLRVEPLVLPTAASPARGVDASADDALSLFVRRVRAADHRFAPGPDAWPLLRDICCQLDGLPLALEMAAARVSVLGLQGLRDALASRFAVLTRGSRVAADRHRTLQAALDWSYQLLSPAEQQLFRALGVFSGGFTLDLVMAVAADESRDAVPDRWAVVDTLAVLVDRSLVAVEASADPPRYRLLETMRAYAGARLVAHGELQATRHRHARALLALCRHALSASATEADRQAASDEHDNVRDALVWATVHAPALAVQLATLVCQLVSFLSWRLEAVAWLEACAPVVDAAEVDAGSRAKWWTERARQNLMSFHPQAASWAATARALTREVGDTVTLFTADVVWVRATLAPGAEMDAVRAEMLALHDAHPERHPRMSVVLHGTLALCANHLRDFETALHHRLAERDAAARDGRQVIVEAAETNIVATLHNLGRYQEALDRTEPLLAHIQEQDTTNNAYVLALRTAALQRLRRHAEVRSGARALWAQLRRYRLPHLACEWSVMLANEARHADAARIIGFLHAAIEWAGEGLALSPHETFAEAEVLCRAALGDAAWDAALAQGRLFDDEAAFACLGA